MQLQDAVSAYQTGYLLGPVLKVDGIPGPATSTALQKSQASADRGAGSASPSFSFISLQCHCRQRLDGCRGVYVRRELLQSLERWRSIAYPNGLVVESGYRCPGWNRHIGGAHDSQHMYGCAIDPEEQTQSVGAVAGLNLFSGIGYGGGRKVKHVDRRDVSGHSGFGHTVSNPITFRDGM